MANWKLGKIQYGFLETATSAGTLTLTASSKQYQILTGTQNHSVRLPDATTLKAGIAFNVLNLSTGTITVYLNDNSTVRATLATGAGVVLVVNDISTTNGTWSSKSATASTPVSGMMSSAPGAAKTSNYTVVSGDNNGVIAVDTNSGPVNITLPAPSANFKVTIKDLGKFAAVNPITVVRNGSELIDGVGTDDLILNNNSAVTYTSDGTNWSRASSFREESIGNSGRMLIAGGTTGSLSNAIDYLEINVPGNGTNFGNLTASKAFLAACASTVRGLFGGGDISGVTNAIDYVTIATTGSATSFGTLSQARSSVSGCSNFYRGLFVGGNSVGSGANYVNTIDYVVINTTGNATSFGTLTGTRQDTSSAASTTRAVFGGGFNGSNSNAIEYVAIDSTGSAVSFGTLTASRYGLGSCSSTLRALWGGGVGPSNVIDYVTIATTGNATSFGTLSVSRNFVTAASSKVRGVFAGGDTGSVSNAIDYVTIATTGNATSFGNLTSARSGPAACSSAHGGLR